MYCYVKFDPTTVAATYPGDYGLNKFESTLPEDASKQVTAFLAYWFLLRRFFLYVFLCKNFDTPLWPHLTPGDRDLKNI